LIPDPNFSIPDPHFFIPAPDFSIPDSDFLFWIQGQKGTGFLSPDPNQQR
jgi:hypothetical protein